MLCGQSRDRGRTGLPFLLTFTEVEETCDFTAECQVENTRASVAVFGDADIGLAVFELVVLVLGVIVLAV